MQTIRLTPAPEVEITADVQHGKEPALVFLHGLSSLRVGEKSDALLRRAQRRGLGFARFDFRGHGESHGSMANVTMSELIADGIAVVKHMGPSILVGSSLGGLVAAWMATAPELRGDRMGDNGLVRGLLLLCPALGFLPKMVSAADATKDFELVNSGGDAMNLSRATLEDARRYDETQLAEQLDLPTLIAHGDQDEVVPAQLSQELFDAIPSPRKDLWMIPGGDHRLNQPIEAIYDRLEAFLLDE